MVYGLFNTYIDIEISNDMIKLMEIKNFLETIKKDDVFNYIKYKDELLETVYFFFCGNQIEYNLFLDDFVILKENDLCFNIENLPDDMDKENIIEYITDIYEKIKKTKLYKHIKKEGFSYPVFEK